MKNLTQSISTTESRAAKKAKAATARSTATTAPKAETQSAARSPVQGAVKSQDGVKSPAISDVKSNGDQNLSAASALPKTRPGQIQDVAQFLRDAFMLKTQSNPQYSLRAFAKKLGLSPGGLSHILARKKRLSLDRADTIARALELKGKEYALFLMLAQIQNSKSTARQAQLMDQLRITHPEQELIKSLEIEQFKLIAEWYGLPLLEAITHFGENAKIADLLAKQFGLSKPQVLAMIERLEHLEFIEATPHGYRRVVDRLLVNATVSTEAVQACYQGLLTQCSEHIKTKSMDDRALGTEVFALDLSQMDEIRELSDRFLKDLRQLAIKGKNRTHIVQALSAVFTLTPSFKSEGKNESKTESKNQTKNQSKR